jgi:hypothetical protein
MLLINISLNLLELFINFLFFIIDTITLPLEIKQNYLYAKLRLKLFFLKNIKSFQYF